MAFPSSPNDGKIAIVNGIRYTYNATLNVWFRTAPTSANVVTTDTANVTSTVSSTSTTTGALKVAGGVGITGNVYAGNFFYANGAAVSGQLGYTGSQGTTGYVGSQGTTGYVGSQGIQGNQGAVGATGPQGNTGATGPTGPQGATGATGYTGSQGVQGAQGASFDLKGSVATVGDLPSTGNKINDAYIVTATGDLYIWNGTSWFDVGKIVGATGATGPQGTTGYTGSRGASGLQGDVGATGPQGNVGATGVTGYAGSVGATGATGPTGAQGSTGVVGYVGSQGVVGYVGSAGLNGYLGSTGSTGPTGPVGATGATGVAGTAGYTGSAGTNGTNGATGPRGYTGSFSGATTDTVTILNLTPSTTTTTGALVVSGGAGIDGNVYAGAVYTDKLFYANGVAFSSTIVGSSNVIHVAKNGNDNNNGTINAPFLTIKAALAAATSGQTVNVAPGVYTEDNPVIVPTGVSLKGDDLRTVFVQPQTPSADLFYLKSGTYVWGFTIRNYLANGFSFDPSTPTQNIYVSPYIQNLTSSTTTGTAVKIDGSLNSAISTKAMIVGFFTIINRGGRGIHITNEGYSQLVNIYTIACDVGVLCESGAFCTLNGSDSSIGNYGLKADGYGALKTIGQTYGNSFGGSFQIRNLPIPPRVNQVMIIEGDSAFYSIDTISQTDSLTWQVSIQEVYNKTLAAGTNIRFYQRSAVVASSHTFEYVGAGTNPATALPQYGGIPIEANEVIQTNGGRVTFTSTDHKGNFKIGANLVINQGTGTITGDSFNRSMFALLTPYILALEG